MSPLSQKYLARFVRLAVLYGIDVNRLSTMTFLEFVQAIDDAKSPRS